MAALLARRLEQWFRDNGGYLNPSLSIAQGEEAGVHWRTTTPIASGSRLCTAPHSVAFSYLNALVDDRFPVFTHRRSDFKIEAIGFFYLMIQYVHRDTSFWKPYLDTLPKFEDGLTTPLWFERDEDLQWLEGTDVLHAAQGRLAVYKNYYSSGIAIFNQAGMHVERYTWDLFKWAITMFTSRSFSSRAIRPADSKYWTTYKTGPRGQRQTVLLDMSHTPAEDLDFSVLFPVLDAGNHKINAKVDWSFDPGRFTVTTRDTYASGDEVFNNYGAWKGNDELLLGYGFCIADNPNDTVMLTLKPPPSDLQDELIVVHPGYFDSQKKWKSEKATFHLKEVSIAPTNAKNVFHELPESLVELLLYILRHERGLPFSFVEHPLAYLTEETSTGRRYLPHIARTIVQSIVPKLMKLQAAKLPQKPRNEKQTQARVYRESQVKIIQSVVASLRAFTRSLFSPTPPCISPRLVTLERFIDEWIQEADSIAAEDFLRGVEANAGTRDIGQLRMAGWEEDMFVLLLCYAYLDSVKRKKSMMDGFGVQVLPEYIDSRLLQRQAAVANTQEATDEFSTEAKEQSMGLMELVRTAARARAGSLWEDERWSDEFIAGVGGEMIQHESIMVMVPSEHMEKDGEARLMVYIHG